MQVRRRRFFVGSALGGALSWMRPARAAPVASVESFAPPVRADATLRAYVDVLIPADETPSGTALGVDSKLLAAAKRQSDYQRLLDLGLDWLNRQARAGFGRDFPSLGEGEQQELVSQAAAAGHDTLPRVFFEWTRADAFFHYYGRPESWRGIRHYRGPPQPLGYLDHTEKPSGSR